MGQGGVLAEGLVQKKERRCNRCWLYGGIPTARRLGAQGRPQFTVRTPIECYSLAETFSTFFKEILQSQFIFQITSSLTMTSFFVPARAGVQMGVGEAKAVICNVTDVWGC